MKNFATLLAILSATFSFAQTGNNTCASAIQICLTQPVTYPAAINAGAAEAGPDYGCLGSENNPAWFLFRIGTPGNHTITETNSNARDLDYILFGPFTNPTGNCDSLDAAHTAACSYSGGATEIIDFISINSGDYYLLLVTNYSNLATNVTFTQTDGTGDYDCEFEPICAVSLVTATPSACDTATNQYSVSGSVFTFNPPPTGTLTISDGIQDQVINSPFNSSSNFTLNNLPSNGASVTLTAVYSAANGCQGNVIFTAPEGCLPCDVTVEAASTICEGANLNFTTTFAGNATYQWTGPNSYSSTEMNPVINNISQAQAGTYTVLVTGTNCVAQRDVIIDVIAAQRPQIIDIGTTVCEGDILFLSALEVPGGVFQWNGPNSYTADGRNAQVDDISPAGAGMYVLGMSLNGCQNRFDTLYATVNPKPIISIHGDTIQTPNGSGVLYASGTDGLFYYWNFYGSQSLLVNEIYTADRDTVVAFWNNYEGFIRAEVMAEDTNGCMSDAVSLSIHVTNSEGISSIQKTSGIEVFPNPANEKLFLQNKSEVKIPAFISDANGRILLQFKLQVSSTQSIPVDNLASGMYILHAGTSHLPIIIQH